MVYIKKPLKYSSRAQVQETDLRSRGFINSNDELVKQFRILTSLDGSEKALIEVNGEYTPTPNGYLDGINVGGK